MEELEEHLLPFRGDVEVFYRCAQRSKFLTKELRMIEFSTTTRGEEGIFTQHMKLVLGYEHPVHGMVHLSEWYFQTDDEEDVWNEYIVDIPEITQFVELVLL